MTSALSLQGKTGTYSPVEQAEQEDRIVRKWVDSLTSGTTDTMILSGTSFNLVANTTLYITEMFTNIETFSDNCEFSIVKCTGPDGTGTAVNAISHVHLFSAAAGIGFFGRRDYFIPAVVVKYAEGWRSVAIEITAGDATTDISVGWAGYWEIVSI